MSTGRFHNAIQSFDEAILLDPTAYLSYYRRATAALSLGRTSAALADLDQLLVLKPEFAQAHFDRANVLMKEGELTRASEAIESFLKLKGAKDEKGLQLKVKIESGLAALGRLKSGWEAVIEKGVKAGKDVKADKGLKSKADECVAAATGVLEVSPNHLEARSRRGECRLALGELDDAISDWR
jgi:DnaJ family protein C protein 3